MDDGIMLTIDNDGVAHAYDDTYDIVIHCDSRGEQDKAKKILETIPRWIPVSERLPDLSAVHMCKYVGEWISSENVLVCDKDGRVTVGYYDKDMGEDGVRYGWSDDSDEEIINPVAWMPLPEPYKGGEQDEQTD